MPSRVLAAAALLLALAPASARADEGEASARGFVFGFEVGAAGAIGAGDDYGAGLGKALVLGYRVGRAAVEWHFAASYGVEAEDERLRGDRTAGELGLSSFTVRYLVFGPRPLLFGVAGVGATRVPLITPTTTDEFGEASPPSTTEVVGLGAVAGGAIGWPVPGGGIFTVEARGYVPLLWDLPRTYADTGGTGPNGGVAFTPSTDDVEGVAWSLGVGLRLAL